MSHKNEKLYCPADKYAVFNNDDPDLHPIVLRLPDPPDITLIDGYGLHPDEQFFRRLEVPKGLSDLEKQTMNVLRAVQKDNRQRAVTRYKIIEQFWELVDENVDSLADEIDYIKKIHWYLRHGYWCFIDGKPTWLPPWYFQYLNFWKMQGTPTGYPDYRDVGRRRFIFRHYCYTTTETFKEIDKNGHAIKGKNGYETVDIGHRVCYGPITPKRRREGQSNESCNNLLWIGCRNKMGHVEITADTGSGANDIWSQIFVPGWNGMPLFLEPINDSSSNPSEIRLIPPRNVFKQDSLGSIIGFTNTANERGNDKRKLYGWLDDEAGKTVEADVWRRNEITKLTLSQYEIIHGYSEHPSTVEEMKEGGIAYKKMFKQSNFYVRKPNGQTISGSFGLFNHCWDGMDGYIGPFGESIIGDPTERQIRLAPKNAIYAHKKKGAKQVITEELNFLLKRGTPSDIATYREIIRKNPRYSADCWIGGSSDMGWDVVAIDRRMAEIERSSTLRKVDFEYIGDDFRKGVYWIPNEDSGKFVVSELFLNKEPYRPVYYGDVFDVNQGINVPSYMPLSPICCSGADSFKWGNKAESQLMDTHTRMSDGGGAVYWLYDAALDGGKEVDKWASGRIICTYSNRPSQYEYFEDMIKMIIYFNSMLLPERNVPDLLPYFLRKGMWGYLLTLPRPDGTLNQSPGYYTQDKTGLFSAIREYNKQSINREQHGEVLQDMKDIQGKEQLFKYDRLTSVGLALEGAKSMGYLKSVNKIDEAIDINLYGTEYAQRAY